MIRLSPSTPVRSILCLGAHSDDIEIGCGGTLLRLIDENPGVAIRWVVFSTNAARESEARDSSTRFLAGCDQKEIIVKTFRDGFFPWEGDRIKESFEELKAGFTPDLVFTHFREDLHQDHRTLNQLTWNTFRNHFILEYEIPKYEGDLGRPSFFVALEEKVCHRKVDILLSAFPTQSNKNWFTADTFWAMLRLRGVEANSPTRFAEAFHCRKLVL